MNYKTVIKNDYGHFLKSVNDGVSRWCAEYPDARLFSGVKEAYRYVRGIPTTLSISGAVIITNYGSDHEREINLKTLGGDE